MGFQPFNHVPWFQPILKILAVSSSRGKKKKKSEVFHAKGMVSSKHGASCSPLNSFISTEDRCWGSEGLADILLLDSQYNLTNSAGRLCKVNAQGKCPMGVILRPAPGPGLSSRDSTSDVL